jgi:hypothetical protein
MGRLRNPRVPLRLSRRGLCRGASGSSIGPPNLRQSTDLSSAPARVLFPGELLHSCSSFSSISRVWRGSTSFPAPLPRWRGALPRPVRAWPLRLGATGRPAMAWPRPPARASFPPGAAPARGCAPCPRASSLRGVASPLAAVELPPPLCSPLLLLPLP